jgi:hypothetical protein
MEREGVLSPSTVEEVQRTYEELVPAASTVVSETARAMAFDETEFDERVTDDVVATAHDALFASLLVVTVGPREAFDDWHEDYDGEVIVAGSDNVPNVVWHAPEFADRAVAATFADERQAAVSTLRRQAFGRLYDEHLERP